MEVILLEKVTNLGSLGDKVNVKPGYARNFLIPFGKAVPATAANMAQFEQRRTELEKAAAQQLTDAQKRADELNEIELTITAKAGDEGKLFGSIGARDLAESISATGVTVSRSEIRLPAAGPIRNVGEFDITVQLHSDISVVVKVYVEAE